MIQTPSFYKIDKVTEENIKRLENEQQNRQHELDLIRNTSIQDMWMNELEKLETEYLKYREYRENLMKRDDTNKNTKKIKKKSK